MHRLRLLLALLVAVLLAGPASATWSIVVLNRKTGEVGVACATCLAGSGLRPGVPVIVVGKGAAAMQALSQSGNLNELIIWNGLHDELRPNDIIQQIRAADSDVQFRQFGIAGVGGPPRSFTGAQIRDAGSDGVRGWIGDWEYAIQGNSLTGLEVIEAAERAFVFTEGDTSQRLMAAMDAARVFGGDGRCSCHTSFPQSCGSPPPSFTHTAYQAFVLVARLGDADGTCGTVAGCASGSYYLDESVPGIGPSAPDAVVTLRQQYDAWRASMAGRPDHLRSEVDADLTVLPADGATRARVLVRLVDVDGVPLTSGGQQVSVVREDGAPVATVGAVVDRGDGTHEVELVATHATGRARFAFHVAEGGRTVRLHPPLELAAVAPAELHLGSAGYSASEGTPVPLLVRRGAGDAGAAYRILGSFSGTSPGTLLGTTLVPLNRDRLFDAMLASDGSPPFAGASGALDAGGAAAASVELPPHALDGVVGSTLAFCAVFPGSASPVSNVVGVPVAP